MGMVVRPQQQTALLRLLSLGMHSMLSKETELFTIIFSMLSKVICHFFRILFFIETILYIFSPGIIELVFCLGFLVIKNQRLIFIYFGTIRFNLSFSNQTIQYCFSVLLWRVITIIIIVIKYMLCALLTALSRQSSEELE